MTVQFFIAPIVCFCTTWGNKINEILHLYLISSVQVFPGNAKQAVGVVVIKTVV